METTRRKDAGEGKVELCQDKITITLMGDWVVYRGDVICSVQRITRAIMPCYGASVSWQAEFHATLQEATERGLAWNGVVAMPELIGPRCDGRVSAHHGVCDGRSNTWCHDTLGFIQWQLARERPACQPTNATSGRAFR